MRSNRLSPSLSSTTHPEMQNAGHRECEGPRSNDGRVSVGGNNGRSFAISHLSDINRKRVPISSADRESPMLSNRCATALISVCSRECCGPHETPNHSIECLLKGFGKRSAPRRIEQRRKHVAFVNILTLWASRRRWSG